MKQLPSKTHAALLLATAVFVSGCSADHTGHSDKISPAAGDAVHAATVMQTVDPWPEYVLDTDIITDGELAVKRANDYKAGETKPLLGERSTGGSSAKGG
jgi:hypothetical protein